MTTVKKSVTTLAKAPTPEVLALLAQQFPVDEGFQSVSLPRLTFVSQDVTKETGTGRNKTIEVIIPAGTFFREYQELDENDKPLIDDETGKPIWNKIELGTDIDLQIVFQRKQLKYYDKSTKSYTSSNVFDNLGEEVTLYANRVEVGKGLPADLKLDYMVKDENGKEKSALEENRVLYAIYEGELHQLNLRGSSMFAWFTFARTVRPSVPAVIIHIDSEEKEAGSNRWNQMLFTILRPATADEANEAAETMTSLMEGINERKTRAQEKADFAAA